MMLAFLSTFLLTVAGPIVAQTESVLYNFTGEPDGAQSSSGLILDGNGNLYGTTNGGGQWGNGTVFEISPGGAERVLYSFNGGVDGLSPTASLLRANGKLYGTTLKGGANSFGTVFSLTPTGLETVLSSFTVGDGGGYPEGALIWDKQGNLYGTNSGFNGAYGNGAVFEISPTGVTTILYEFSGGEDGLCPYGRLVIDANGTLYGTTYRGGASGYGTVFELTPGGTEIVLYSFTGGVDGSAPVGGLLRDGNGNLYGTTSGGGSFGYGTVFMVTAAGTKTVLHNFNATDGYYPTATLVRDSKGNLYGTTVFGGSHGQGTVFRLNRAGIEKVLYSFSRGADGGSPEGELILDKQGNLYGTTAWGGNFNCVDGCGVVFKVSP
jgi:uncharacterized repeat protein (TIGR03803 family)